MICQRDFARLMAPNFKLSRNWEDLPSAEARSQPSAD